jgi:hypothetical protein
VGSLHATLTAASKPTCKLCAYLATLSTADAAEWQAELALPVNIVGNTAVVNELARRGCDLTEMAVRRHRSRHVPR